MLNVLNFCAKDRDIALKLLNQIHTIGGVKHHEFILQCGVATASQGLHYELESVAREAFGNVVMRITDEQNEQGWPQSANVAWRDACFFIRMKIGKPFLWLEPDCAIIPPKEGNWADLLEKEYIAGKKPFMGAKVERPQLRMSGVGFYPDNVGAFTRRLPMLDKAPWDQHMADDIVPNAHFTPLIQNIWNKELGKPETIPTFPDQESLSIIDPQAIIFHRCKDGTLIDRIMEGRTVEVVSHDTVEVVSTQSRNEIEELKRQLAEAKMALQTKSQEPLPTRSVKTTSKKVRTKEEQEKINERMRKAREGRKKTGIL